MSRRAHGEQILFCEVRDKSVTSCGSTVCSLDRIDADKNEEDKDETYF